MVACAETHVLYFKSWQPCLNSFVEMRYLGDDHVR